MFSIARVIRSRGGFGRRRDLLALGYNDRQIRAALANAQVFRVRHGWYATPDAPEPAVRAVRVGGRLTGISALESYGLNVPRESAIDVVVPRGASRLRSPDDRRVRLATADPIITHWTDEPRRSIPSGSWRVSLDEALLVVLQTEGRDIAVACCSAIARYKRWPQSRMDAVFARAPLRAQRWRTLVCALDDAHGETLMRLWLGDAGVPWEPQPRVVGAGRLDGRVSPNSFVEVDGGQHDPGWTGAGKSTWEHDHDRDTTVVIAGGQVLRYTYRQLYGDWPRVLAAIRRARQDDLELLARRKRHPSPPRRFSRSSSGRPPSTRDALAEGAAVVGRGGL